MNRSTLGIASALLVLAMTAASVGAGVDLPEDVQLPVHWDLSGQPDSWAGKWQGLLMPPAITAAVSLLFWFLPALEPRGRNFLRSQGLYLWGWAAVLLLGVAIEIVVLSVALGWGLPANHVIIGALGVMFVLIGNQLGKSRSMYMVGFRTPWTLASEEVWIKTHRLAGKLMVLAGLAAFVAALLPLPSGLLATVLGVGVGVAVLIPLVYSFLLWRREQTADQPSE
jgi:uncharacterized membrane protein